jgi:cell division protein FtsI/penicillin-binding protein 2
MLAALSGSDRPDLLRLEIRTNAVLTAEWGGGVEAVVHPGSLWKPLAAMQLRGASPVFGCTGCWNGRRHGKIDVSWAIAYSCNEWFRQWGVAIDAPTTALGYVHAFADLMRRRADHPAVVAGMRFAAEKGTAAALGSRYLAKTGTGPSEKHAGDGWIVAAWPADMPEQVALLRARGVTGARAAELLRIRIERERW